MKMNHPWQRGWIQYENCTPANKGDWSQVKKVTGKRVHWAKRSRVKKVMGQKYYVSKGQMQKSSLVKKAMGQKKLQVRVQKGQWTKRSMVQKVMVTDSKIT
jgi:hypothetical protein